MSNKSFLALLMFVLAALPLAYLGFHYNSLPEMVATHYNVRMEPDNYSHKSSLWVLNGIMSLVAYITYLILDNIQLLDPKRAHAEHSATYRKIGIMMMIVLVAINFIILAKTVHPEQTLSDRLLLPALGIMFIGFGNYMINIKPNYIAGIRVPWTLHSDYNWRKTHQLGGKLWFAGGTAILILGFLLPMEIAMYFFMGILAIMVLVPITYSYMLFKNGKDHPDYYKKERE